MSVIKKIIAVNKALATPDSAEWTIAIRKRKAKMLFEGDVAPFHLIPNDKHFWRADPFLLDYQGRCYLFAELYDRKKQKGALGVAEIVDGKSCGFQICMELPYHLSYPCVWQRGNEIFLIPECNQSHKITIYKNIDFPLRWEEYKVISNDVAVDTTPLQMTDDEGYFTTIFKDGKRDDANLYWFHEQFSSQIIIQSDSARSAGHVIYRSGEIIRPSQRTRTHYGEALIFNRVTNLAADRYKEDAFLTVYPPQCTQQLRMEQEQSVKVVIVGAKKGWVFNGVHTYNLSNAYEVIDLRACRKPNFQSWIKHLFPYIKLKLKAK